MKRVIGVCFLILILSLASIFSLTISCDDDDDDDVADDDDDQVDDDDDDQVDDDDTGGDDDDDYNPDNPVVLNTWPADDALEQKLSTVVAIQFNKPMNKTSVETEFSMPSVTGSFSWNAAEDTVTFTPDSLLTEGTNYDVNIGANAESADGWPLDYNYSMTFDTATLWTVQVNGPNDGADFAFAVGVDDQFNVYAAGRFATATEGDNIWVAKYGKDSIEKWSKNISCPPAAGIGLDRAYGIAVAGDGTNYVTGRIGSGPSSTDIWLQEFTSSGSEGWDVTYNGTADGNDNGFEVTLDNQGNVIMAGYETTSTEDINILVAKYDSTGTQQWIRTHDEDDDVDLLYTVGTDSSDNVFVGGYITVSGEGSNAWVRKYDSSGTEDWTRSLNGDANGDDWYTEVTTDSAGNVYAAGQITEFTGAGNAIIRKYDAAGTEQWTKIFNGADGLQDYYHGLVVGPDGSIYLAGATATNATNLDILIVKMDSSGNVVWNTTFDYTGSVDNALSIALDKSGNFYVAGKVQTLTVDNDIWIRKYDNDGNYVD